MQRQLISGRFAVVTVGYAAAVGYVTLGEVPWRTAPNESAQGVLSPSTWADPVTWEYGSPVEFMANVAMFVPVGLLLCLALPRLALPAVLALCVAFTAAIEILQLPLQRVSDPRDLVANTAGALLGVGIGAVARLRATRRARPR